MAETIDSDFPWGPGGPRLLPETEIETVTFSSARTRQASMQTVHFATGANTCTAITDQDHRTETAMRAYHRERGWTKPAGSKSRSGVGRRTVHGSRPKDAHGHPPNGSCGAGFRTGDPV